MTDHHKWAMDKARELCRSTEGQDMSDETIETIELGIADILEFVASNGKGSEYVNISDLCWEAAAHIRELEERLSLATRFTICDPSNKKTIYVEARGEGDFAVGDNGYVLNDKGSWEVEPFPSSRTHEFIIRTRFSLDEALLRARAALETT